MSEIQGLVPVDRLSRRDALRRVALAVTSAGLGQGILPAAAAQVHEQVEHERTFDGEYTVKFFNEHEFHTLERLSELVVPADEGGPSGRAAGAPEFIDLLVSENQELADIFTGGILWLDAVARARHGDAFIDAGEPGQLALLDALVDAERNETDGETQFPTKEYARFSVFGVKKPSDIRRGLQFFGWARQLIVDAYYTSPAGIRDLGFVGNAAHSEYTVPSEALDYAIRRSPFRTA